MLLYILLLFFPVDNLPGIPTEERHSEIIGYWKIDSYKNDLYLEMQLEKRLFAKILQQEATCAPQEMVKICGDAHVKGNFSVLLDGAKKDFILQSYDVGKNNFIYRYHLGGINENAEKITIRTDYGFEAYDHGVVKVLLNIRNSTKALNLNAARKTMQITLPKQL